jgi:hypothetical protein
MNAGDAVAHCPPLPAQTPLTACCIAHNQMNAEWAADLTARRLNALGMALGLTAAAPPKK